MPAQCRWDSFLVRRLPETQGPLFFRLPGQHPRTLKRRPEKPVFSRREAAELRIVFEPVKPKPPTLTPSPWPETRLAQLEDIRAGAAGIIVDARNADRFDGSLQLPTDPPSRTSLAR
ncbi:MAG: Sulfurtransferase [Pseudarthrobacter sp.]|nr:Sulfurtransferase [Pseudarthrobacter sp.]